MRKWIDMHCDTLSELLPAETLEENSLGVDRKRMEQTKMLAEFFACFVYVPDGKWEEAYQKVMEMVARMECETKENKKLKIEPEKLKEQNFVVFGMKACDVQGVEVLDKVFLADPVDSFYAARREHGTIVAMACHEPEETCFCKVFGIDAAAPAADVATWMIGEDLYWKALTEKGEKLTEAVKELLAEAEEQPVEEEKEAIHKIVEKLPYMNLSLEGWGADALSEKFDSPIWEELYKPCLKCGTCTFVCPTCQCYDIKDYDTGHGVSRYRCWDSCMYSDFTMMAHGNNRTSQMQRFRQRFMHKLVYYPANNDGMYSCVGCGRCVEKCPSALNIVKVIKAFEKQGGND